MKISEGRKFKGGEGDVYILKEGGEKKYWWMKVEEGGSGGEYGVVGLCENIGLRSFGKKDGVEGMGLFI